jgi:predicted solute-binding protein
MWSSESETSVALSHLFYQFWFGKNAYQYMKQIKFQHATSQKSPIRLLIGDKALHHKNSFYHTLDLGEQWHIITNLPFVFALWQSHRKIPSETQKIIISAAEKAERKMHYSPLEYFKGPNESGLNKPLLETYWKNLYYRLGPKDFESLCLFLNLLHLVRPLSTQNIEKLIRLQNGNQITNITK